MTNSWWQEVHLPLRLCSVLLHFVPEQQSQAVTVTPQFSRSQKLTELAAVGWDIAQLNSTSLPFRCLLHFEKKKKIIIKQRARQDYLGK